MNKKGLNHFSSKLGKDYLSGLLVFICSIALLETGLIITSVHAWEAKLIVDISRIYELSVGGFIRKLTIGFILN